MKIEYWRNFPITELRAESDDNGRRISGYAAIFDQEAVIGGQFREVIRKGAFTKTIAEGDVVALAHHDKSKPLARTSNGSLEIREDEKGLSFSIREGDTTHAIDTAKDVARGNVRHMSFGFEAVKDEWTEGGIDGDKRTLPLRELREVRLFEISPVTFPAYGGTSVEARGGDNLESRAEEILADHVKTQEEDCDIDNMQTTLEPLEDRHSQAEAVGRVALLKRKLELKEKA